MELSDSEIVEFGSDQEFTDLINNEIRYWSGKMCWEESESLLSAAFRSGKSDRVETLQSNDMWVSPYSVVDEENYFEIRVAHLTRLQRSVPNDKYRTIKPLGSGCFGSVDLVENQSHQKYARKTAAYLADEALILQHLTTRQIPGIPRYFEHYDVEDWIDGQCLIMEALEYYEPDDWVAYRSKHGPAAIEIIHQIHGHGVIHMDITRNLFSTINGFYLIDFGMSSMVTGFDDGMRSDYQELVLILTGQMVSFVDCESEDQLYDRVRELISK